MRRQQQQKKKKKMGVCADVFYKLAHARIVRLWCVCGLTGKKKKKKDVEVSFLKSESVQERTKCVS